jgi:drug/metabolite transporter (DMT)-like permease
MVTYLFPLGGVLLGVLFLGERLSWQVFVGGILVVASLAVANMQPRKQDLSVEQIATADD